jgi:hypothetical protein
LKNKVSSLEDYAVEVIQETEKDFNNAMGQEFNPFDQPKRKKTNKNQSQQWKTDRLAKISQTTKSQQIPPHPVQAKSLQ